MNRNLAEWIGTVFFIGKLPLAPGTWTSLIATLLWFFIFKDTNSYILPIVTSILFIIGIISSNFPGRPPEILICTNNFTKFER